MEIAEEDEDMKRGYAPRNARMTASNRMSHAHCRGSVAFLLMNLA